MLTASNTTDCLAASLLDNMHNKLYTYNKKGKKENIDVFIPKRPNKHYDFNRLMKL